MPPFIIVAIIITVIITVVIAATIAKKRNDVSRRTTSAYANYPSRSTSSKEGSIKILMPLSESDLNSYGTEARFDGEQVFYTFPHLKKTEVIGRYKKRDGSTDSYDFYDQAGYILGKIEGDTVTITMEGVYKRFADQYGSDPILLDALNRKKPSVSFLPVASVFDKYIEDFRTEELMASFTGDKHGAACALCAMLSYLYQDTKYHAFLYDWWTK